MSQLQPYLPYYISADLLAHPDADLRERVWRRRGVILFADISGFTQMSEALSRHGQEGTEELTSLINDYSEVMIDLIGSYGGMVSAFGGDAMTVLFPADADLPGAAARAVQCALDMQELMLPYAAIATQAGRFSLAIKIGIAAGPTLATLVGDPDGRLHALLAGSALDQAALAEHHARTGEVALTADLAALLPDLRVGQPRDGFVTVQGLSPRPRYAPLEPLPEPPESLAQTLGAFLHPAIAARLRAERPDFVGEHRHVTVLFVGFDGFDYDNDPAAHLHLQHYLGRASQIVRQYDGDLNKIDMGDKGSKYIVVFGAPVAHENDVERAMHCALALRELRIGDEAGLPASSPIHIGIASGLVYCGLVGASTRREYTVMGDTVNLAARLMQAAAPGAIMVASGSQRRAADGFIWETLEPLAVKGRALPVSAYRLERARLRPSRHQEPAYKLPMVGREAELQTIEQRLGLALQGQGQVIGICAEAGMGKSRLVAEAIRIAARRGFSILNGECLSHGSNISYLPWHNLLRGLFGIDPAWSGETQVRHLREQLGALAPQLGARIPLLEPALNLAIGESELTRSFDARLRKEALEATVLECVRAVAEGQHTRELAVGAPAPPPADPSPLLLVIEDCHWIDALSHDLLEVVGRGIADRPVVILLAYRPPEHEQGRLRVARMPHFTELQLREFSLRETEWLIGLKFGYLFGARGVLPPSFIARITERSQGNPFYIDQMINFIQDQGVNPADSAALERLRLPDGLRALIISRIDRLSEQEQITLKVASVLGRVFRASWLWGIYPELGRPEQVYGYLDTLSRLDLTPMERAEPELEYLFKHMVTQEVAYESLSYATRTSLHEAVGRFIEAHFADDLDRYLDLLAFHYGRSENAERQRHYFLKAGRAAQATYANAAAIDYYQRLQPLLSGTAQIPVHLALGEVLQLVGRWDAADESIGLALRTALAAGDPALIARCKTALAGLQAARGLYDEALALIDEAMPLWDGLNDPTGHYETLWVQGSAMVEIGAYTRGLRALEHGHEIAAELGDRRLIARSIGSIGLVYIDISDYEMALYCLERSAQMAARFNDWSLLARAQGGVGFIRLSQHRAAEALAIFDELLARAAEIGDRRQQARMIREIGRCHQRSGDAERALQCYAAQVAMCLELGERRDLSVGLGYIADTYAQIGDLDRAEAVGDLAVQLCAAIRLAYWECEFRADQARLRFRRGDYAGAAALNGAALAISRRLGTHKAAQLRATLLAAQIAVTIGATAPAESIAALGDLDEEWYGEHERAAIAATIAQIAAGRSAEPPTTTPPPLALPPLSPLIAQQHHDLDALIAEAEQVVEVIA